MLRNSILWYAKVSDTFFSVATGRPDEYILDWSSSLKVQYLYNALLSIINISHVAI